MDELNENSDHLPAIRYCSNKNKLIFSNHSLAFVKNLFRVIVVNNLSVISIEFIDICEKLIESRSCKQFM